MTRTVRCPAHVDPGPAPTTDLVGRRIVAGTVVVVLALIVYLAWIGVLAWVMA